MLSRAAVDFLEAETTRRGEASVSPVLEEIILECRKRRDTRNIDARISAYYDSFPEEEREEEKRWGGFAQSQLRVD